MKRNSWPFNGATRAGLLVAALCLAANTAFTATPLLDFQFNEGSGGTTTDDASQLVGSLGVPTDPTNDPMVITDSPSGAAGDNAVGINLGNDLGTGFLVVDDRDNPILTLGSEPFTMETWVYIDPNDTRQYEGIGAYGGSYKLGFSDGELVFTLFGIVDIPSGLFVPLGSWHHVAAVWEPGVGVSFYMDGFGPTFVEETRDPGAFGNNYLTIGAERVTGNSLMGAVDRFRIHSEALTASQLDSVAATPKAPLASTLVAYDFNESAPPFANSASADRPAITSNQYLEEATTPTFTSDTPSGQPGDYAIHFERGQRAVVPDLNTLFSLNPDDPSFTLQAWVKFDEQPGGRSVFFFSNGPGGALSFSVTSDRRVFVTTLGVLDATSDAFIPDDNGWHHIAVVHENGVELRYYVDGALEFTRPYTGSVIFTRTATEFFLGSEPTGGLQFVGSLDRLKASAGIVPPEELDFWPIPGVEPEAPSLSIETAVQVSWPTVPAGYILQSSTDLNEPRTWTDVPGNPSLGNQAYFMLFPTTGEKVFYRLVKP